MTVRLLSVACATFLALAAPSAAQTPAAGSVVVYVDGLDPVDGDVVVRLYRSADGFPWSRRGAERERRVAAAGRTGTVILDGVRPVEVAVLAFHDADRDGELDLGPDGQPTEGWALSRLGSARRFEHAAVVVEAGGVTLTRLGLVYPPTP